MNAFIVCAEPFPNGMASTKRIICYAKALISAGTRCTVVCYKKTEKKGSIMGNTSPDGIFEGIPYLYVGRSSRKPEHKIPRLFSQNLDKLLLLKYLKKKVEFGDVVIGFVNGDTGLMSKSIDIVHHKGGKFVRELCELPFFGSKNKKDIEGLEYTIKKLFPKYDGIISISESLSVFANKYKSKQAKLLKLPILVEFTKYCIRDNSNDSDIPYIFHSGTLLEQKDGILGMIEAFGKARKTADFPIRMICTGNLTKSPHRKDIERLVNEYYLKDSLVFTGFLTDEDLQDYLSHSSLVIINKSPNIQNTYCFSTKLAEYMAAGKAIIITDVGEAMNWLSDGENAIVVPHDDNDVLANAIIKVMKDRELRQRLGENARIFCRRNFDYISVSKNLKDFLSSL